MITRIDLLVEECFSHLIEIAYHWEPGVWSNYAVDKVPVNDSVEQSDSQGLVKSCGWKAHQNKVTLALELLRQIGQDGYDTSSKSEKLRQTIDLFNACFCKLNEGTEGDYEATVLGRAYTILMKL